MNRRGIAVKKQGAAPSSASPALTSLVLRAAELHRANRLQEAEALYRNVLAVDPRHADALHLLGVIAHQCGQHAAAAELIEQAMAEKPREPDFHNNLGLVYQALGRFDDAIRQFRRALAINPKTASAAGHLAMALLRMGRAEEAISTAAAALAVAQTPEAASLLAQCLVVPHDAGKIGGARDVLLRALEERWVRPDALARTIGDLLSRSGVLAKAVRRAHAAWPVLLPAAELDLARARQDRLLQALLVSTQVCVPELEHYLTSVRAALLGHCLVQTSDVSMLALACALAQQCFLNEYVFCVSEDEVEQLRTLSEAIEAARSGGRPIPPLQLAVLAAYRPLDTVAEAETLLAADWPAPLKNVLRQQIQEPALERELRGSIRRLTAIKDDISRAVRQQYEDHPYPRWSHTTSCLPPQDEIGRASDILIAGCGTGRHPIETAMRNATARILAIDLSLASLSYAARKAREAGIANLEFAQADILALESIGRTFDYVESAGVLHHMADPWAGWRALLAVLRPGGVMRIGLYSDIARRPIAAARAYIAEHGYGSSTEEIRRFRQEAFRTPALAAASKWGDFYSISNCRDLLFHVQEQRMTIPGIKEFLTQNGLEFIGFAIADVVRLRFRERFPGKADTDLDCWHLFEQEHPSTFAGMYQFGVRKPS